MLTPMYLPTHFNVDSPELVKAITHAGYTTPTDVQARAVPAAMSGRDLLVSSQTGSGKTAAFVWPALERILAARLDPSKKRAKGQTHGPRILVLAPTRELAQQVGQPGGAGVHGGRALHGVDCKSASCRFQEREMAQLCELRAKCLCGSE